MMINFKTLLTVALIFTVTGLSFSLQGAEIDLSLYNKMSNENAVPSIKYVRLWQHAWSPNRTTRAIDAAERITMKYEDNPRAEVEPSNDNPLLRLSTQPASNKAIIRVFADIHPQNLGSKVLWVVSNDSFSTSGNFSSLPVMLELDPSSSFTNNHNHLVRDYTLEFGFDFNNDGVLQDSEKKPLKFGINIIGNSEYNYANSEAHSWYVVLGSTYCDWAGEFLDTFLGDNSLGSYATTATNHSLGYAEATYDQKNGLGCELPSLNSGIVKNYTFSSSSDLSVKIMQDKCITDRIREIIQGMNISAWYTAHPADSVHVFNGTFHNVTQFSDEDLNLAYRGMTLSLSVAVYTEKDTAGKIIINNFLVTGNVFDLYDFVSGRASDKYGCMSVIQTCFWPLHDRNEGKIFITNVALNKSVSNISIESSNYDDLIAAYLGNF